MPKEQAKKVKVVLKKDHRHAGKDYKAGDDIEISEKKIPWLKDREVV